ncbi:hypothetical protein [Rubinisphaera italica]|uniref:Uncharacterized protein n=1 Tax=Rubinisphaera italica TaxID=2527969 RepID=A0A5C5XG36_9PLAN|nr:hypothetical protein [Rubinisphaera italica]TWT61619.1 hypothetical protein Pan54_23550 [Rubinisphaera italica]
MFASLILIIAGMTLCSVPCSAHPISVSDAFVEIEPDRLVTRIEVYVEDLYLFHNLPLDADNKLSVEEIKRGTELHRSFLEKNFFILDQDGTPLMPKFLSVDDQDLPGVAIPFGQLMFFKLNYHFEYPISEPPQFLTFLHKFVNEKSAFPAEVQVKVKPPYGSRLQSLLLPNQPWTTEIPTKESATKEAELSPQEQMEQDRQNSLGMRSYGETYAFLYVEPNEIRLETLVPLATLSGSLDIASDPTGKLDLKQQEELKPKIEELFRKSIQLKTDGEPTPVEFDRIEFFGVAIRDFSKNRPPQVVSMANARVGVILSISRTPSDNNVELKWELFNEFLYQVSLILVQGESTEQKTLRQVDDQNVLTYSLVQNNEDRQLPASVLIGPELQMQLDQLHEMQSRIPLLKRTFIGLVACLILTVTVSMLLSRDNRIKSYFLSVVILLSALLIAPTITTSWTIQQSMIVEFESRVNAEEITEQLLTQVYQAVNERDETATFEALENVVSGPLLREMYLEIRQSLTMETQNGAVGQAGAVEVETCELLSNNFDNSAGPEFRYLCRWNVPGRVEHWGHIHERTNSYLAEMQISADPDDQGQYLWKITELELQNVDQKPISTSVRKF